MLFLLFRLGDARYALAADEVAEVLPLARLTPVRRAPDGIAGSLDHRGTFLPVVDLSLLECGRAAAPRMSTRIMVVRCPLGDGREGLLGLVTEYATEMLRCAPTDFAPFAPGPRGQVARITVESLVPVALRAWLADNISELAA